jgi:siroheme synthase-like protein
MANFVVHPSFDFPIFVDPFHVRIVVVGGGRVGRRKARLVLDTGAPVRVVDLNPQPEDLQSEFLEWRTEAYRADHLERARLVFAAATAEVNERVLADGRKHGILVCRTDHSTAGDFITPAVLSRGHALKIAVSTGGSPALARLIRDRIGELFNETFGAWVEQVQFWRLVAVGSMWDPPEGRDRFVDQISDLAWFDRHCGEGAKAVEQAYEALAYQLGWKEVRQ